MDKKTTREMRTAVTRAFKNAMKSLEQEPSLIIISGNATKETDCPVDEIADWLFHGGEGNDNSND
jgi:hypothetical protein